MYLALRPDSTISPLHANTVQLPVEIWEQIFTRLSDNDLWMLRSLNRVAYEFAARVYYGTHWIGPYRQKIFARMLERVCDTNLPIIGLVHTLHVHSNLDLGNQKPSGKHLETKGDVAKRLRFLKNRQQLFEKVVSNPNLRVDTLTILCDEVILPHTHLIWRAVSHSLVHLELHFAHQSAYDALLSLSGNKRAYCPHLRSFVLIMGIGTFSFPIFYSIAQKRAYETPGYIFWNIHSSYASSRDAPANDHRKVTLELIESCLVE